MIDGKNKKHRARRKDLTRQYGETIEKIRQDHLFRYVFASKQVPVGSRVLDIACGCGYGSWLMREDGNEVTGVDISSEAISYAERHYKGPTYLCQKAEDTKGQWDAIVTLETLEHLANPEVVLTLEAPLLIASVPNEERYPFKEKNFARDLYPHQRHYTPKEFEGLLNSCGWKVVEWWCQETKLSNVSSGTDGIFLIAVAVK